MNSIGNRLNNICDGNFIGWKNKVKTQFRIMTHGCPIPPPSQKQYATNTGNVFLSLEIYISMTMSLERRGAPQIGDLTTRWPYPNGETTAT